MAALNPQELQRYERQISLPEFGLQGQAALKESSVLIVGVGGLGTPAAQYLAAAGLGRLGLVDGDRVERHNLQRQILYGSSDVGALKVERAAARLRSMNPEITIEEHPLRLDTENAADLLARYEVILDGTDHIGTRHVLNRLCAATRKPLVYGALFKFEGVASVFCGPSVDAPCYACLHGANEPASGVTADCNDAGVLGVLPGVIGLLQATETIKLIARTGGGLAGRLLQYDALDMKFREWKIARDPACPVCGAGAFEAEAADGEIQNDAKAASPPGPQPEQTGSTHTTSGPKTDPAGSKIISQISVQELQRRLNAEPDRSRFRILDVREPHELEVSALPDVLLIPVGQLPQRLDELNPNAEYAVLCKAGGRSRRATEILAAAGFDRILNVVGGINAWAREIDPELPEY